MTALRASALMVALTGCLAPAQPEAVRPARVASVTTRVAILKTDANPMFEQPIRGFLSRYDGEVRVFGRATPDNAEAVQQALDEFKPSLVFCLGNGAAALARRAIHDMPVLFALVPGVQKLGLHEAPNFMGIAMEPKATMEFTQFRLVDPGLRRILTFYGHQSSQGVIDTTNAAIGPLGMQLIAVPVTSLDDIKRAYAEHADEADAVWMLSDPVVINNATFAFLREESLRRRKVLLTSLTDKFAEAGALMSASLDLTSVGSQAALMVLRVLQQGVPVHDLGIQPPIGMKLAVNLQTAGLIGFDIDPRVLPFINRVYAHTVSR